MDSSFEKYLIQKGYLPFSVDYKNDIFCPIIQNAQSSINDLHHYYYHKNSHIIEKIKNKVNIGSIPENELNDCFIYGLCEHGKGPTLAFPRDFIEAISKDKKTLYSNRMDDPINRILKTHTPEFIFNAIMTKQKIQIEL